MFELLKKLHKPCNLTRLHSIQPRDKVRIVDINPRVMAGSFFWEDELCKTSNLEVLHSSPPEIWDKEVKTVDINPNVCND